MSIFHLIYLEIESCNSNSAEQNDFTEVFIINNSRELHLKKMFVMFLRY